MTTYAVQWEDANGPGMSVWDDEETAEAEGLRKVKSGITRVGVFLLDIEEDA